MIAQDPKSSIRPYRKVDMGTELEQHDDRLKKLERLEGQVRLLQGIALSLILTFFGIGYRDCSTRDQARLDQAKVEQKVETHLEQPHKTDNSDVIKSLQQVDTEHGERLITIEKRLYIRKKK